MKRALVLLAAILWLAGAGAAAPSGAAPPEPAAGSTRAVTTVVPCAGCHGEPAGWLKKAVVHAPVRASECLACHGAHASKHPGLIARRGARACRPCHEPLFGRLESEAAHGALASEKACLACHDPHASDRRRLLAGETVALCRDCHESARKPAAHPHAPVARGDCLACHDPHSAPRPALARKGEPDLCGGCHRLADPKLAAAHKGLLGRATRCSSCHAPHGSDAAGMIRPVVHAPFAAGECAACHPPAKAGPGKPAAGAAPGRGRTTECTTCHEPFVAGHPTPKEVPCTTCHAPHASSAPALIAGPEKTICLSCHKEIAARRAGAVSFHPAAGGAQDCTVCHAVHAGRGPGLLKRGGAGETCSSCHSAHAQFSHPMGEGVPDRSHPGRPVGCRSCHDPHGTSFPQFLLADPRQDLCLRCHAEGVH